jgi:hypothetical protein
MTGDLERIGHELQAQMRETGRLMAERWPEMLAARKPRESDDYIRALYAFLDGDRAPLAAYLRSDEPMTDVHRAWLADVVDGSLDRKPTIGRPKRKDLHRAEKEARGFLRIWKNKAEAAGVTTHGRGGWMKETAARFVVDLCGFAADPDEVLDLMQRPKNRRK